MYGLYWWTVHESFPELWGNEGDAQQHQQQLSEAIYSSCNSTYIILFHYE